MFYCSVVVKHVVFWHKDAGRVTKLYRKPELIQIALVQGAMQKCSFDCCLTDRADLTVGPTLSSKKSGRVFLSIATR